MFSYFQRLGKSLMLPVAVMPICAILMGIGYALDPSTLASSVPANPNVFINSIANILTTGGSAIINNIAILFAIGVAVGMAKNNDGTAAISSLVAWLIIVAMIGFSTAEEFHSSFGSLALNSLPGVSEDIMFIAYKNIQNPFVGILCGCLGSGVYNKFKDTKLPDFLAFFSGKRFVAIVTAGLAVIISVLLLITWPYIYLGLSSFGNFIKNLGPWGVGIYMMCNRLLIPVGLHHALNNVFWFTTIGIGDITHFWAGETSADVGWDLGIYMSGFFPCMMFGVPGAALAFIVCSKNKKATFGIVGSVALCAFLCGVTEPFEFLFMFLAFPLYIIYSILYGIMGIIVCFVGFRAGFSFSGGCIDLILSSQLPAAQNTWMIIPLGIGAFVVFFLLFYFYCKAFKIPIPGDDLAADDADDKLKDSVLEDRYSIYALRLIDAVGGSENIEELDHCVTRLRLILKDPDKVDEDAVHDAGATGVIRPGKNAVQIIVGTNVQFVFDKFKFYIESFGDVLKYM
ncbi:MAG: PTS transporter subunit EIIC [Coriobacteriia bacterium]|nr:PTS transporter subunit EIIC [Coriobacteriia bacterium]